METIDPRLTRQGKIDFRLQRQLAAYTKEDPPPNRVKPVPVSVIQHVAYAAHALHEDGNLAIADMIPLAFFILLRPGEYTGTNSDTSPFRFCDVQLFVGGRLSRSGDPICYICYPNLYNIEKRRASRAHWTQPQRQPATQTLGSICPRAVITTPVSVSSVTLTSE
jgi:hypothetical protein